METGDPKQVAVLGVMAFGAIGFLFTRIGGKAPVTLAGAKEAAHAAPERRRAGSLALAHDPFSHARLAPKATRVAAAETFAPPSRPTVLMGDVPALPTAGDPLDPGTIGTRAIPAKEKVKKPEPPKPVAVVVLLEGTTMSTDAAAFLSVAGAPSKPYRANAAIAAGLRLRRIEDGTVTISSPQGDQTLNVGESKSL